MFKIIFHKIQIAYLLVFSIFLFSCSESELKLDLAEPVVIFDFQNSADKPSQRLSVSVKLQSDLQRIDSLQIINTENGYEWISFQLDENGSSTEKNISFSNFLPKPGELFPSGDYSAVVTDKTEKEKTLPFSLVYDKLLFEKHPEDFPAALGEGAKETIALYAQNGDLLYYGNRKSGWITDEAVWNEMSGAVTMRVCWSNQNRTVLCFMPPVLKK